MAKHSKEYTEFIEDVLKEKRKQLMSFILDIKYWQGIIDSLDEDKLRNELQEEQNKRVIDRMGKVLEDNRDMPRIDKLNQSINDVANAKKKLAELKDIHRQVMQYVEHVKNPGEKTVAEMEEIVKNV